MVGGIPRTHPKHLQCIYQQLVEHQQRTPAEGFPQVSPILPAHVIHILKVFLDTTSSRLYVCTLDSQIDAEKLTLYVAIVGGLILLVNMGPGELLTSCKESGLFMVVDSLSRRSLGGREEEDLLDVSGLWEDVLCTLARRPRICYDSYTC